MSNLQKLSFDDERVSALIDEEVFIVEYDTVIFVDGDLNVDGDFCEWFQTQCEDPSEECALLVVTGDLTVSGRMKYYGAYPGVFVGGTFRGETIESDDSIMFFENASIQHFVYRSYEDGIFEVAGTFETPLTYTHNVNYWTTSSVGKINVDQDGVNTESGVLSPKDFFVPEVLAESGDLDLNKLYDTMKTGSPITKA